MKTGPLIDDSDLPRVHTAIARFFMPPSPTVTPPDVDLLLPAAGRLHEPEVMRAAAFVALWLFAATGCFLPWEGSHGWWIALRIASCLAAWVPAWFVTALAVATIPGTACAFLEDKRIISREECVLLTTALVLLAFTVAALLLLLSPHLPCRIVGGVWLLALGLEGVLRLASLIRGKTGRD